jgi:hypothetical protein
MISILLQAAGWIGAVLILIAYLSVSTGRLAARSMSYQLINAFGSAGILANSAWNHAWPSAALNLVWLLIGVGVLLAPRRGETATR